VARSTDRNVELNIKLSIYMYIRTSVSRTVTVSVYTTVTFPIQQHTAVQFNSWLLRTAMKIRLQQTVTRFYFSDVRRPFKKPSAVCVLWILLVMQMCGVSED